MEKKKSEGQKGPHKFVRNVKNYALQPYFQVRLGVYSVVLSLIFAVILSGILYLNLGKLLEIIVELTGVPEEVRDLLDQYINPAKIQVFGAVAIYAAINIGMTILFTHHLVGPTIAFRRHVQMISEGNYQHRTILRKGDAFAEVAEDLNKLSQQFEQNSK